MFLIKKTSTVIRETFFNVYDENQFNLIMYYNFNMRKQ